MSTTIGLHRTSPNGLWTFTAPAGGIGPGTSNPIGLTAGQLVMMIVATKSYAIASALVTGDTIDRPAAVPASVGYFLSSGPAFNDTVTTGGASARFDIFNAAAYLNPGDGLFYPACRLIVDDGLGNEIATNDPSGIPSGSTLSLFGSPPFAMPLGSTSGPFVPITLTINQASTF